jgi:hypothetical protein
MPSKDYRLWLSESAYIVVDLTLAKGRLVSFVVRLMAGFGKYEYNIVRYDTAHGAPHRDSLGLKKGLLKKDWFFDQPLDLVLQTAIEDLKANYEKYCDQFRAN